MTPQLLALPFLLLLLVFLLLVQATTTKAFVLPPSTFPARLVPFPISLRGLPPLLPLERRSSSSSSTRTCSRTRRRALMGNGQHNDGDQDPQQQGQGQLLDELERQLKGSVPPTVYVQETKQGKMRIPLPEVRASIHGWIDWWDRRLGSKWMCGIHCLIDWVQRPDRWMDQQPDRWIVHSLTQLDRSHRSQHFPPPRGPEPSAHHL
jgi:hypothetical protein